jgi:hypothetical protein
MMNKNLGRQRCSPAGKQLITNSLKLFNQEDKDEENMASESHIVEDDDLSRHLS